MKIIELEQGSQQWLSWRQQHITATDAGIILGLNNFKGIHQLWQEKMGFVEPEPSNPAMLRGQMLESIARDLLYDQVGLNFKPMVIESDIYPWMGASLDGINYSRDAACEIKCMKLSKHLNVSLKTLDPCHYAQIQHQIECSGVDMVYYVSYHPEADLKLKIINIYPDREYIEEMIEKEKEFYFETMCNMQPTRESFTLKQKIR
jgi:putative phage-type endonuclease